MPTVKEGDKIVRKPRLAFTQEVIKKVAKNYKALNILFYGLDYNEFNCVSACDTTKEVWDTLETIYEGTSQAWESRINLYVHQNELFKMLSGESIKDMYMRFTKIINILKSLGITYTNEEMVRKMMSCITRSK